MANVWFKSMNAQSATSILFDPDDVQSSFASLASLRLYWMRHSSGACNNVLTAAHCCRRPYQEWFSGVTPLKVRHQVAQMVGLWKATRICR
jgi:hypothetical protein